MSVFSHHAYGQYCHHYDARSNVCQSSANMHMANIVTIMMQNLRVLQSSANMHMANIVTIMMQDLRVLLSSANMHMANIVTIMMQDLRVLLCRTGQIVNCLTN